LSARTFDYEYLQRLVQEHPDYPVWRIAELQTRYERVSRCDASYPEILPSAISAAISRYRSSWEAQGVILPYGRRLGVRRRPDAPSRARRRTPVTVLPEA
jgi:hypothetical protein